MKTEAIEVTTDMILDTIKRARLQLDYAEQRASINRVAALHCIAAAVERLGDLPYSDPPESEAGFE